MSEYLYLSLLWHQDFASIIKLDFFADTGKVIPLLVRSAFNCLTVLFSGNWRSYGTDRDDVVTCFVFAFLLLNDIVNGCSVMLLV